jgi:hypothetical protein
MFVKRVGVSLIIAVVVGCGAPSKQNPTSTTSSLAVSGDWNLLISDSASVPMLTIGIQLVQSGNLITGSEIPYTGSTGYGGGCAPVISGPISGKANGNNIELFSPGGANAHMPVDSGPSGPFSFTGTYSGGVIRGTWAQSNECIGGGVGVFTRQ